MIKLKTFLFLLSAIYAITINAQTSFEGRERANGLFEDLELLSDKKSIDKDIYFNTLKDMVRTCEGGDKINIFFNQSKIDTSTIYLKFNEVRNLYDYTTTLLSLSTNFQKSLYQEVERMKMMKHLVAHDYDSIYGFALYYFDEIRQLPSKGQMFLINENMKKYESSIVLYQTDKKGLIEIALSCLEDGLRFPLFEGMGQYSSINFFEHGWFGDDETILSFYEHIYKKNDTIENEEWELLSPSAILLTHVSNPFLSETTFKSLIDMMSDNERSSFLRAVFDLGQSYVKNEASYKFLQMLFKYFPAASKYAGYNKLHLAITNLDVISVRNMMLSEDKTLLQEDGASQNWDEFYRDDATLTFYTPLQLSEYKLDEFEKALIIEQQKTGKSIYTDNELFYTFKIEQMKKIVSLLKQ